MNTANDRGPGDDPRWEHIGRAAESFARRIARDAGRFAERIEEHASELARDVARDWRRAQRDFARRGGRGAPADVQQVLHDVRGVLVDIIDGVDELIEGVFRTPAQPKTSDAEAWVRAVSNRAGTCSACTSPIAAGDEAYVRRTPAGVELRCGDCGGAEPHTP